MTFTRAIVRPPSRTFAQGITTSALGKPNLRKALRQHAAYVRALRDEGVEVYELPPDDRFPDSTFVEDCAVLIEGRAVWCRPGAQPRRPEADAFRADCLLDLPLKLEAAGEVRAPASLEGGDVCQIDDRLLVGLSARTNAAGAAQLADAVERFGIRVETIPLPQGVLHLKSAISYLGDGVVLAAEPLASHSALAGLSVVRPIAGEEAAANALAVGPKRALFSAGNPGTAELLKDRGFTLVELETSEFRKMDGGLSCLSLRL